MIVPIPSHSVVNPDSSPRINNRNKLLPRERVAALIDPESSFLELSPLAGHKLYENIPAGGSLITGIGLVCSLPCIIVAHDSSVKGGAYFPITVKKHLRAQEIACENKLPCLYLVDSGGAYLPLQDEVFPDRFHFGRIFANQARMSAMGIPQLSAVFGLSTAGGAYVPAMSDEAIIVDRQGSVFLGGPALVRAATGEEVDAETLGGGKVHSTKSGVTDHLAIDDLHAISLLRARIQTLPSVERTAPRKGISSTVSIPTQIKTLLKTNDGKPFPMREVVESLMDDNFIDEFKPLYGTTLLTGFSFIFGFPIGIIANQGILFSESAQKGAHFIQLCNQRGIPLLFLHDITGFMVGKDYEHQGIAKDGAKLVNAVACASVPKISIIVGNSFGAGNYAMCGRAYDPRFLFMWPDARIGVMGPDQAASVLTSIRRGKFSEDEARNYQEGIRSQYHTQASALYSTARLWDDGIIDPDDTRRILGLILSLFPIAAPLSSTYGIFRM
jgi:3-methylcrotonyl-CoA carboxylase beta subunit